MYEFKTFGGGLITIDGEKLFLKNTFVKENCAFSDVISFEYQKPTPMATSHVVVQTEKFQYRFLFPSKNAEKAKDLYKIIKDGMELYANKATDTVQETQTPPQEHVVTKQQPIENNEVTSSYFKFCPECGTKAEGMRFCPECGAGLASKETTAPKPVPPVTQTIVNNYHAPIQQVKPKSAFGGLKCPHCKGHNIDILSEDVNMKEFTRTGLNLNPLHPLTPLKSKTVKKKKKSAAKIGLGLMTGGTSLLVTGVSKKQKSDYYCHDCGKRWVK